MGKYLGIAAIILAAVIMEASLWNMWQADKAFALGKNLDQASQFSTAYSYLTTAVEANPDEPTFRDELAYNQAVLAAALFAQESTPSARELATQAVANSDMVVASSPDALPYWKNRTKIFYYLATIDPKYYLDALDSLKTAVSLAPTDAKIWYNYGMLVGRLGDKKDAVKILEKTLELKPDYTDAKNTLEEYKK